MKPVKCLALGHYPPPITGERLCWLYLLARLPRLGREVQAFGKYSWRPVFASGEEAWFLLGAERGGFLRDVLWLALLSRKIPRVYVNIHNRSWQRLLSWRSGRGLWRRERLVFVVLTEPIARSLREAGWQAEALRNTLTSEELAGLEPPPPRRRLLWISAVTEEKGFGHAYEAFLQLRARDAEWRFDVYGSGPLAAPARFPGAVFHGSVSGPAKRAAFADGGILLLPSSYRNETQPLCVLEAMACGLPTVASTIGGLPEMLGTGPGASGLGVPSPVTSPAIVRAVEDVWNRYTDFSVAARQRYDTLFSPGAYDAVLKRILTGDQRDGSPA